ASPSKLYPYNALLTRIAAPITETHPDARVILESFIEGQKAPSYNGIENGQEPPKPIDRYPQCSEIGSSSSSSHDSFPLISVKQAIVEELFNAIAREDNETIRLLIQHNIVTANTTHRTGQTPLLQAVSVKNVFIVKQLLDLGADPNALGQLQHVNSQDTLRTPLMVAASIGSLPLVKLLFEPPYSADDTIIAPDGQIALRLAAENGHRAIVEYLPSRRIGHFLRFKTRNAKNIARAKKAAQAIVSFIKFFIWEIPKFFLWSVPKHVVVLPVVKSCKYCWSNRKVFGSWCKRKAVEVPKKVWKTIKKVPRAIGVAGKGVWKFGTVTLPGWLADLANWIWQLLTKRIPTAIFNAFKWLWQVIKKVPKATADMGRASWKFVTVTLAGWLKNITIWIWKLITKRIPKAIIIMLKWLWSGAKASGRAIWSVVLKFVSLLHTIFSAITTFFRNVTLRDVWNTFCDFLSAVFITVPKTLWSWIANLGTASYKVMVALFGCLGGLVWWICAGVVEIVIYIPRECWTILQSMWNSVAGGAHEVWVWINPKA
ncbi:hypothetical protein CVT25_006628, partial [Psilocybe cyanescens]